MTRIFQRDADTMIGEHSGPDTEPFHSSRAPIHAVSMDEVTRILSAIEKGDQLATAQLLPLVYDELRKLAAQKLAHETPGQTLEPTALVHEAYLRLMKA